MNYFNKVQIANDNTYIYDFLGYYYLYLCDVDKTFRQIIFSYFEIFDFFIHMRALE